MLESTIKWWHSLSFVDRRQAANKDTLVDQTETAAVSETMHFYGSQVRLAARCSLLAARCSLLAARCSLLTA